MRWWRRQADEIADDRALRLYGACLSLTALVTAWWMHSIGASTLLASGTEAICWPFLPDCHELRVLPAPGIEALIIALGVLSVASAAAFVRAPRLGWWLLLATEALTIALVSLDFRLRANQHLMAFFAIATFLFLPEKRRVVRYVVMLFYFAAGLLKLNPEWLSGAALYAPVWFFKGPLLPVACTYVVVLELVMVWGLLARRPAIFWAVFMQFVVFHIFSWPIVGAFYPLLMFGILAIFPLDRLIPASAPPRPVGRMELKTTWALVAGFLLLQLVPLAFPGDHAVTGEGRLFSLHMFDAKVDCSAHAKVHDASGKVLQDIDLKMRLPHRIACDPVVYFDRARTLCLQLEKGGLDLDLSLESRRTTEPARYPVVALDRFCAQKVRYTWWRPNDWILKRAH